MVVGVGGVQRAIAMALGLSPLVGCTARVIQGVDDFAASSGVGSSSGAGSTSGVGSTSDPTTTGGLSVGSEGDGGESSSADGSSTGGPPPVPACLAESFPEVVMCLDAPVASECVCDDDCMWAAASLGYDRYPEVFGCYYPGTVTCTEVLDGSCCFTVQLQHEDFCGEGRPLMVDAQPRVAQLVPRTDWAGGEAESNRPELAGHWLRVGLAEHASVASFARFALELAAVGAPPALLSDAARAMQDEVRHAQLAFELARRFGSGALGPGPLDAGPSRSVALGDVVLATVREGCIGETIAAAQAELAATRASDPQVVRALQEIAADEARHAALAWRVVQWALGVDPSLRCAVASVFAGAAQMDVAPSGPTHEGLEAYGVLGREALIDVRARTLSETIRPFADALLTTRPSAASCTP